MANPGTLPITLVTILLLVAPGYVAIRLFLRYSERKQPLDRTEKIVWSSAASLLSLFVLYVTSPIHYDFVTAAGEFLLDNAGIVSGTEILRTSLPTGVLLYLLHLALLLLGAVVVGRADLARRDDPYSERRPWYYAFTDLGEEQIEVVLQDGSRVSGQFVPAAWDPSSRDLILEEPVRQTDGVNEPLGRTILISSDDVSAVVFVEEDPNSEAVEETEPSEEAEDSLEKLREVAGLGENQDQSDTVDEEDSGEAE
ncbi:MAG: DUF6338 family protein [Halobaculum sp.]